ncbi:MAG: HIRAN domain-containing protein [Bacillota bacterium]
MRSPTQNSVFDSEWLNAGDRAVGGGPLDLLNAAYGADLINCGALVEGLQAWGTVCEWGETEIGLIAREVHPIRLVNAVAEYRYGEFAQPDDLGIAMMAIGAALGPWVSTVPCSFEKANLFVTRVVGCRYHMNGPVRLDDLSPGDRLLLIPEPNNPHDASAIRVMTDRGHMLGYIRRTIARKLATRLGKGAELQARVVLVLGDGFGPRDRLYVEVRVSGAREGHYDM